MRVALPRVMVDGVRRLQPGGEHIEGEQSVRITRTQLGSLVSLGGEVLSADGQRIGSIGQVYVDDSTGEPNFVTVRTGLFGTAESFVPLQDATVTGNDLQVVYDEDEVKEAPRVDPDGRLTPAEEQRLYSHYGLPGGGGVVTQDVTDASTPRRSER
jgi:PRC-barrel domain